MTMTSSVPYLIRAIYDWILDNQFTPYLIVDAKYPDASVPLEYAKDGQIVLNISPVAVRDLRVENEFIEFSGRFAGVAREIYVPMQAVFGIVARENNEGMWFPRKDRPPDEPTPTQKGPPRLRIVD